MNLQASPETFKTKRLELGLALYLFYQPIVNVIMMLSSGNHSLGIPSWMATVVRLAFLAAVAICVISSAKLVFQRIKLDSLIVILAFAVHFALALADPVKASIAHEQNMLVLTFLECMPVYVLCRVVADWRALWKWITTINYVVFALYLMTFFLVNVGSTLRYRTFASGVTPSAVIFMVEWAYRGKRFAAVPMAVSLFLVVTCGRRSSVVLLLLAYVLICFYRKKYKYIIAGALLAAVLLLFGQQILTIAYDFISSFGVRPRNLYRLVAGTANDDSGRFDRWGAVLNEVNSSLSNQLLGMGLVSDRAILMNHLMFSTEHALYPHGIIVELIAHYGYPLGLGIFLWLFVFTPLRGARMQEGRESFFCVFILYYSMMLALLFQGSYLQDKEFFMLLGLAVWLLQMAPSSDMCRDVSPTQEHPSLLSTAAPSQDIE